MGEDKDRRRPTLSELQEAAQAESRARRRSCPACGARLFIITNTWRIKSGVVRRLYKCAACGYCVNSSEYYDDQDIATR